VAVRICIDCSPLLVRSAGVKTWTYHWVRHLRAQHRESIQTFLEPDTPRLDHRGGLRFHPWRLAALQTLKLLPARFSGWFAPECDVFHVSNLLRSDLYRSKTRCPALSATIHDLTAWTVPRCHLASQIEADNAFATNILRKADGLIAVSECTKRDAIGILGLDPDKIRVIYPGVADEYFLARGHPATIPYFLFVGTIEPRKNVDTLLSAWTSLPAPFRRENELVIAGMPGWRSHETLKRMSMLTREHSGIRYLGYFPESLLPELIAGAQALVYPSLYEGFGIPVAQAMAAGCPVIASDVSSLPEITAGCAVLIDPLSPGELAGAIRKMGESHSLREALRAAGRERARIFNWRDSAERSFVYLSGLPRR
jgi:glycosyltransferase involved in cell wall biosynthesis